MGNELRNPNIILYLIGTFFSSAGWSVWGYSLLSNVIYLITTSSLKVGYAEGIQGVISSVLAIPFGILADKWCRHGVGQIGLIVGIISSAGLIAVLFIGMVITKDELYWILFGSLALYGVSTGVESSALATMFTNSVPTGSRSAWLSYLQICSALGTCCGPAVAAIILKTLGDIWTLHDMILPWTVALSMQILSCFIYFPMHDKWCLADESMGNITLKRPNKQWKCLHTRHIPYLCTVLDCVFGLASGMSSKFFPLFFEYEVGYSPLELQLLFVGSFGMIVPFTFVAKRVADKLGRVQALLLLLYLGLTFLLVIVVGKGHYWDNKWIIGIAYVFRAGLMNSPTALHRSIVDDYVDSDKRGCWNSLEFVFVLGWSGSAMLGGLLVESVGYQYTFLITLVMQFVSISLYWLLIPLVERKEYILEEINEIEPLLVN